jgi:hypothetical protein
MNEHQVLSAVLFLGLKGSFGTWESRQFLKNDAKDLHIFGPPGSGSVIILYGSINKQQKLIETLISAVL